ncbi:hypothetical protein D9756_010657 [Leucocoprinus leucothites]|uniref:Uncharacterized protein n=1 Tax=Leucocoprinus leucothites TaxID=201217 RepID=A0A8H5CT48_9AGAR|nr:hypothetical protein D9756_010657 [Leucoagaricus leucothites]
MEHTHKVRWVLLSKATFAPQKFASRSQTLSTPHLTAPLPQQLPTPLPLQHPTLRPQPAIPSSPILRLSPLHHPRYPDTYPSSTLKHVHAHDVVINIRQFDHRSSAGSGPRQLFKFSMPITCHDSSVRHPTPKCHLGTRNEDVDFIADWTADPYSAPGTSSVVYLVTFICQSFNDVADGPIGKGPVPRKAV